MNDQLELHEIEDSEEVVLKFFESRIQAGFPSPAQGMFGDTIDLNRELISNPAATFCARVIGSSMVDAGINNGDLLIIDKSLEPHDGDIAVCFVDGDFTVKRISLRTTLLFTRRRALLWAVLLLTRGLLPNASSPAPPRDAGHTWHSGRP